MRLTICKDNYNCQKDSEGLISGLIIVAFFLASIIFFYVYTKHKFQRLIMLLSEVANYNQILKNLDTLDQLEAVGNPVRLTDRSEVIKALEITREDLIRALNTEKF